MGKSSRIQRVAYRLFKIETLNHLGDVELLEGPGMTLEDAVEEARQSIREDAAAFPPRHMPVADRRIVEGGKVRCVVSAAEVLAAARFPGYVNGKAEPRR